MMYFLRAEDDKLLFYVPLSECGNCHKKMIKWYEDISDRILYTAKQNDIVKESYRESGICMDCVRKGGFLKVCDLCGIEREFPKGFQYRLTYRAKYPEEDTTYEYICHECIRDRPQDVIKVLAKSDEIKVA